MNKGGQSQNQQTICFKFIKWSQSGLRERTPGVRYRHGKGHAIPYAAIPEPNAGANRLV